MPIGAAAADPYLVARYDSLHDTPAPRRFRALAPMPAGVVYIQQPGEGGREMRAHFRQMRQLGFNALKQIMPLPGWTVERIQLIALEEGIIPLWFGEGGYEPVTPELSARLGVPDGTPPVDALRHPAMIAYQHGQLRRRIERTTELIRQSPKRQFLRTGSVAFDPACGGRGRELTEAGEGLFLAWLRETYGSVERLSEAWNQGHAGPFLGDGRTFRSWDDVAAHWKQMPSREYRHTRDILRFKADHSLGRIRGCGRELAAFDPLYPFRGGGETGLFVPVAWLEVDLEGIAGAVAEHGSFYPSMHFSWHFDQVNHELTRPFYMQAALMADLFKGGWTGGWESTGGPLRLRRRHRLPPGRPRGRSLLPPQRRPGPGGDPAAGRLPLPAADRRDLRRGVRPGSAGAAGCPRCPLAAGGAGCRRRRVRELPKRRGFPAPSPRPSPRGRGSGS